MDCNKANDLMMDYMDFNISEEDRFLLDKHLKECKQCREEFELYSQIITEFEIDKEQIETPCNFEEDIMKKIEDIEPEYIKKKEEKHIIAYVSLGLTALCIAIFTMLSSKEDILLNNIENMPIAYKYYSFFDSFSNIHLKDMNFQTVLETINTCFPYVLEGIKYTSIVGIICIIIAQIYSTKKESLKI